MSLIVAISLAIFVFVSENLRLGLLIFAIISSICAIICVFIFKTKFLKLIFVCLLLSTFAIGQIYAKTIEFNDNKKYANEELVVSGRICSNYKFTTSGNLSFYLDNLEIIGANFSDKVDGKFVVYTNPEQYNLDDFEIGRSVFVFGKIRINFLNDDSKYSLSNLSNNVIGSCYAGYNNITINNKIDKHFDEKVRSVVFNKLSSFDLEYSDIGYAMMFGDSTSIDDDVESAFRTTGIAHLLAVSGLHVSIIALLVSFVLKLFKVSKMTNFVIMFALLLFYSYLCDFSVSVLRASIMTLFLLYLRARGKCYDRLTALSISLCLILIIDPLKLFNVSLILSFMAVLSIILMMKVFEGLFEKCFHKKISGSLALIFAVQVGLGLVQLYFFNNYSVMSLICNFISVPIATIAFVLLILGIVVSAMIPFMSFICLGYDYLMGLVVKFNYTISKAGFVFSLNNFNFLVVILGIMLLLFLSDHIFIKKRYKAIGASVCLILSTIMIFV